MDRLLKCSCKCSVWAAVVRVCVMCNAWRLCSLCVYVVCLSLCVSITCIEAMAAANLDPCHDADTHNIRSCGTASKQLDLDPDVQFNTNVYTLKLNYM